MIRRLDNANDAITVGDGDVCIAHAPVDCRDAQRIANNGVPHQQTGDFDIDNAQIIVLNEAVNIRDEA